MKSLDALTGDLAAGHRNVLDLPEVATICGPILADLVVPVLGSHAFAVRGILFNRTPNTNWKVTWDQDLTIAVRERREVPASRPGARKQE